MREPRENREKAAREPRESRERTKRKPRENEEKAAREPRENRERAVREVRESRGRAAGEPRGRCNKAVIVGACLAAITMGSFKVAVTGASAIFPRLFPSKSPCQLHFFAIRGNAQHRVPRRIRGLRSLHRNTNDRPERRWLKIVSQCSPGPTVDAAS